MSRIRTVLWCRVVDTTLDLDVLGFAEYEALVRDYYRDMRQLNEGLVNKLEALRNAPKQLSIEMAEPTPYNL
jgi:hypothetical protein